MAVRGRREGREGMKELVAKRQRAERGRGERGKERERKRKGGWSVGEREDEMDEKGGGAGSLFSRQIKMLI